MLHKNMQDPNCQPDALEKVDVAVNIFAKPYQTSLSLLSLLRQSGGHVGDIWLQFEPMGSKYDKISPYVIAGYLSDVLGKTCHISQPGFWLARQPVDRARLGDKEYRLGIRYQHAFENSRSRLLFLMHNDVYIIKDVLGAMKGEIGAAFATGSLGQCWNCPAANGEIMRQAMDRGPCGPDIYQDVRPTHAQLCQIYSLARQKGVLARPYDDNGFDGEFAERPWPLPECRVNEWACLLNLEKTRPLCVPAGEAFPPGAFRLCASHNLDTGTPWFRDMHAKGLTAKNFDITSYVRHWVGTGNKSPGRYARNESNALMLLRKHFPDYLSWLGKSGAH